MPRSLARPLTQRSIDSTPLPSSGSVTLRDHEQRGLALRIWPAGTRSWSFEYRSPVTGKNCRLGLPAGSLSEARVAAKSHRALVALGRDPALEAHSDLEERREAHAKVVSVAVALDDYEAAVTMNAVKIASRRKRVRVLRRALEGFEARAVASIGRGELLKRLDTIQSDAGDVSRNRAQSELRHFLGWCREREIIESIALDRVRRGVREIARDRVLSNDELKALLRATDDEWIFSSFVRVLLYSVMRRGEAAALQARDLDFDARTITVRAEVSKTRVGRTIPMASPIVEMLRARAQGLADEDHVFGDGSNFRSPFSGFSKAFARLGSRLPEGTKPWSLHDIRRTGATRMHEGVGVDAVAVDTLVVEDLLGHLTGVRGGVSGVYNRARTIERQRVALEAWSATLAALMRDDAGEDVVVKSA